MFKKIATGLLAAAATTTLALSLPSTAQASSFDGFDRFSTYSRNGLAKAEGTIRVDWNGRRDNVAVVRGRLYDRDARTYRQGGKCAYVTFQSRTFRGGWRTAYTDKYCGYPGSDPIRFRVFDTSGVRVKVCQIGPERRAFPTRCGDWDYIFSGRR